MIRKFFALSAFLILGACNGAEQETTLSQEISPGGIDYTLIHIPDADRVTIRIAWPTDWAYRDDAHPLAPYIGAQLILAGGADGYDPTEAGERFEDLGVAVHLTPMADYVYGGIELAPSDLEEVIAIANAHLRAPRLDENWLERIRTGFVGRINEQRSSPFNQVGDTLRWAVLGDQNLRVSLALDAPGSMDGLTRDDIFAWQEETLTRAPSAIVVAGRVDPDLAGAAVDGLLAGMPDGIDRARTPVQVDSRPRRILLHLPDTETTHLMLAGLFPANAEGGDVEDILILSALGQGDQSVLFQAVRSELRASYQFSAGLAAYNRDIRIFFMSGGVEGAKLGDVEQVVSNRYAAFRDEAFDDDLAAHKSDLLAGLERGRRSPGSVSAAAVEAQINGDGAARVLALPREVEAITPADIRDRLASAFPGPENLFVIAVSADRDSLPGACVISAPHKVVDCP